MTNLCCLKSISSYNWLGIPFFCRSLYIVMFLKNKNIIKVETT